MSDLVGNNDDLFSDDVAPLLFYIRSYSREDSGLNFLNKHPCLENSPLKLNSNLNKH